MQEGDLYKIGRSHYLVAEVRPDMLDTLINAADAEEDDPGGEVGGDRTVDDEEDDPPGGNGETEGDDCDVFRHLLRLRPACADDALIGLYRKYEGQTLALLDRRDLWSQIELLAKELFGRGQLTAAQAHELAGYPEPR
jgi:hypothetical protein